MEQVILWVCDGDGWSASQVMTRGKAEEIADTFHRKGYETRIVRRLRPTKQDMCDDNDNHAEGREPFWKMLSYGTRTLTV